MINHDPKNQNNEQRELIILDFDQLTHLRKMFMRLKINAKNQWMLLTDYQNLPDIMQNYYKKKLYFYEKQNKYKKNINI